MEINIKHGRLAALTRRYRARIRAEFYEGWHGYAHAVDMTTRRMAETVNELRREAGLPPLYPTE